MIRGIVFDAYGTLYDVQSVSAAVEARYPGRGDYITQIWRQKQLEYTWLRTMMNRYVDFWQVTLDALAYSLDTIGVVHDGRILADLAEAYNRLDPYPDAIAALDALNGHRLAILSNGSPGMLLALVRTSSLASRIQDIVSVDAIGAYKPDPRAYGLVEQHLGIPSSEVLFVSSNGFDVAGAKSFGFLVARIERLPSAALQTEIETASRIGPLTMFKALRMQAEALSHEPDVVVTSLSDLPGVL